MRRWALGGAIAAAGLVALYAAAGYWLAPRFVRDALVEQAARLGLALEIGEVRTDPFALSLALEDIGVARRRDATRLAAAQALQADFAWASLWRDAWVLERAELRAPSAEVVIEKGGVRNWPAPAQGSSRDDGAGVLVESLRVTGGRLRLVDRSRAAPVALELQAIELSLDALHTRGGAGAYALSAALAAGGTLASQGSVSAAPLAAQGTLELEAVSLAKFWSLLAPASEPAAGSVRGTAEYAYGEDGFALRDIALVAAPEAGGRLQASGRADPGAGSGKLALRADALPLALAWPFVPEDIAVRAAAGTFSGEGTLGFGPLAYEGSLAVRDLRLEERGSGNLLLAWRQGEAPALRYAADRLALGRVKVRAPEGRVVVEEDGAFNFARAFATGGGATAPGASPFVATFERLEIAEGTLHFADRSLDNAFEVTIVALEGAVAGFSTAAAPPARVELDGRVRPAGTARIRGTIDLASPTSLADLTARLRNLRLAAFNPYVVKFAGRRIAAGRVSAELRYELRDGRLIGDNDLVFDEIRLGEKLADAASDLPLELAVALLADEKGRITLDIPVRGDLQDPEFDFGAILARAAGNALQKIVTAPFRALAGLLGEEEGERRLDEVRFAAGSAALSPRAEENIARVADALAQRPQLEVRVRGGYDPAGDRAAPEAAERAPASLARERADAVRSALLEHGVAPARVRMGEALASEAGEGGVATRLDLSASLPPRGEGAAAGGGARSVREAQRELNAAGFAAGPVDGILGPRTRAALREFQKARGLEPTGELDDPTQARLSARAD